MGIVANPQVIVSRIDDWYGLAEELPIAEAPRTQADDEAKKRQQRPQPAMNEQSAAPQEPGQPHDAERQEWRPDESQGSKH